MGIYSPNCHNCQAYCFALTLLGGLVVFTLGLSAIIGYVIKAQDLYHWSAYVVGMPPTTAIGFIVVGWCLMMIALQINAIGDTLKRWTHDGRE